MAGAKSINNESDIELGNLQKAGELAVELINSGTTNPLVANQLEESKEETKDDKKGLF